MIYSFQPKYYDGKNDKYATQVLIATLDTW